MKKEFKDIEEFVNDDEVKAFVGKNFDYYNKKWLGMYKGDLDRPIEKPKSMFTANLWAILCLPAWLGYRKLDAYFWGFTFVICAFIAGLILMGFGSSNGMTGGMIAIGLLANNLYMQHVKSEIEKIDTIRAQERKDIIMSLGGTSKLRATLYPFIQITLLFVTFIVSAIIAESLGIEIHEDWKLEE